ncbi:MAG TPA: lysylphosphatidylglycerol synthase transmembrane domain-containing protein [Candidatus Saccharimonadales bacterium]|jgi:uncharacterized membrane protein YbhN (UPF0104 family)
MPERDEQYIPLQLIILGFADNCLKGLILRYNMLMVRKHLRSAVAVIVLLATCIAFTYYVRQNPEIIRQITKLSLADLGLLLALYGVFLGTLVWIQRETLELCEIKLGRKESMLLIMYSSIINFFGPLQSGPAFRAAYLKRRHNIKLKNYTIATLLYYAFYAAFSGLFILAYFVGLWVLAGICLIVVLAPLIVRRAHWLPVRFQRLKLQHVGSLAVATLAQVTMFAIIFYVELGSFGQQISAVPALIYTGAANFALFVSVTPGAIGFRESFVVFSQSLHHLPSSQVVTASLIDRGVYVLYLLILIVIATSMQAKKYLSNGPKHITKSDEE